MTIPWVARVVNSSAPTSTGTKEFTAFGMESCAGAVISVIWGTANDTERAGVAYSWGVVDGTNERCSYGYAEDGASTSDSRSSGNSSNCIRLIDPSDSSVAIVASFDSFVTTAGNGGIKLDFTTVNGDACIIKVYLFGGSNCECEAWRARGTATPTTVTTGFQTDVNITCSQVNNADTFVAEMHYEVGFSHRNAAVPSDGVMHMIGILDDHNRTTTEGLRMKWDDRLAQSYTIQSGADIAGAWTLIESYTSTSFDVAGDSSIGASNAQWLIGLAIKATSGDDPVSVESEPNRRTHNAVAIQSLTWPGFKPGFLYTSFGLHHLTNDTREFASGGVGATDFANAGCVHIRTRSAVSTGTDTGSSGHNRFIDLHNHSGTVHVTQTQGETQTATGFDLDWSVKNGATRYYGTVAIEEFPHKASFSGVQGSPSASFTAQVPFLASFAATQASPTAALAAAQQFRAVLAGVQGAASAQVSAKVEFRVVASGVQGAASASFSALQVLKVALGATQGAATAQLAAKQLLRASFSAIQASPSASADLALTFKGAIQAAQGAATGSFTLSTVDGRSMTFAVVQASPSASLTMAVPVVVATGSKTCLAGSRVASASLAGERAARAPLTATRASRAALDARLDGRSSIEASYQARVALAASHVAPAGSDASRSDLLGAHSMRVPLSAGYTFAASLAGAYDSRSALGANHSLRASLSGAHTFRAAFAARKENC